jgi:hypothetical protein
MAYPAFFNQVPRISLYDPLAEFLGAGGILQYGYVDAVRLAGHSCPTVAAAYWLSCKALALLYPDTMPVRGEFSVVFSQELDSGVTGVTANIAGLLTGAAAEGGFKGIGGRFERRNRLFFGAKIPSQMRFTRTDTNQAVNATANLQLVPAPASMSTLMASCLANTASAEQTAEFRSLWQERVRSILLDHGNDPEVFVLTAA